MPVPNALYLHKLCENKDDLVKKLREWNLIPKSYVCFKCGAQLKLIRDKSRADGFKWRCNNRVSINKTKRKLCAWTREFRTGTFFAASKLSILQILLFVNYWVHNFSLIFIMRELSISSRAAVKWSSFCRGVVFKHFSNNPVKLGGPGKTVEIDESLFGKRKYNRGHRVNGQWVFGGFERGSGRIFMVAVERRDAKTLLPIIEKWIEKGTTIISDLWKAYKCLKYMGYRHQKVNHSLHYKDPVTGAHTNGIESSWRHAKAVNVSNGRKRAHIPGNLSKYMFQKYCRVKQVDRTEEFFKLAGAVYSPENTARLPAEVDQADLGDLEDL